MPAHIGFLTFPNVLQLDLTGAFGVLAAGPEARMHLIWKDTAPVISSDGLTFTPTTTMRECPRLDVICVPGGAGILPLLDDMGTLDFLRRTAADAAYAVSVCTGALVLGAAGLLRGRKATTHWASTDLLPLLGAALAPGRVVEDGNIITSAGVTSGVDMALTLAARLWGLHVAQTIALRMEYAPEPPVNSGTPQTAPPTVLRALQEKNAPAQRARAEAVRRAAARL